MTTERTWEISDLDGSNKRTVTLAQFRAEIDARKAAAAPIMAAWKTGDIKATLAAQVAFRKTFKK